MLIFFVLIYIVNCESKSENDFNTKLVSKKSLETKKTKKRVNINGNVNKGKSIYFANCVSCHNNDPKKKGAIGPIVFGSSKELLLAKLNFGKYPEDYTPKRNTKIMPLMSHLDNHILNLYAFLNSHNTN